MMNPVDRGVGGTDFTPVGDFGTHSASRPADVFQTIAGSPDLHLGRRAAVAQYGHSHAPRLAHAQSLNVDCWRAGVPASAHCSPMLKEFFQSHLCVRFFFTSSPEQYQLDGESGVAVLKCVQNFKRMVPTK